SRPDRAWQRAVAKVVLARRVSGELPFRIAVGRGRLVVDRDRKGREVEGERLLARRAQRGDRRLVEGERSAPGRTRRGRALHHERYLRRGRRRGVPGHG